MRNKTMLAVAALAFGVVAIGMGQDGTIPPILTSPTLAQETQSDTDITSAEAAPMMSSLDQADFEQRWSRAPEDIRAIAVAIVEGRALDPQTLTEIGPEALSRTYYAPILQVKRERGRRRGQFRDHKRPSYHSKQLQEYTTLLQEAVQALNLEAVQTLLAHGVDPTANHSEALFMAIPLRTPEAPNFMLFPDYNASLPIVEALLDAGVDPNKGQYGHEYATPLYMASLYKNIGAMIMLINRGADPWLRPIYDGKPAADSFMTSISFSTANHATAETLFRVLRATQIPPGPPEQVDYVLQQFEDIVDDFASGTGPYSRHTAWRLDQMLHVAGVALDRQAETDHLRARLSAFSYQADGGWFLAADEIHSRYDAPLVVPDHGDQVWGP